VDFNGPGADGKASGYELGALASNHPSHNLTLTVAKSVFEKDSLGGLRVIHRASD